MKEEIYSYTKFWPLSLIDVIGQIHDPVFLPRLFFLFTPHMKMEQSVPETSTLKIQTPGNLLKERIEQQETLLPLE